MTEKIRLTRREEDILKVLWASDKPLAAHAVSDQADISMNTVQSVLRKLLKAGYIKAASIGYSGTVLTREYVATLTEEEYYATVISSNALKGLVAHFINKDAKASDLDDLQQLIDQERANN
ncbi:BlaI/MecI/CopY family transcriptional regulator [Lacticaseibacillus songhuajiangensis]|uniref:BlaI/MecI/CopY family transcriptional regulator n=1 Tax=Lacticaseibacillus songhuajiangensis TaxID=1296539 RepID=UPI0013DE3A25|nr:BlaI/MecI/CopY family transcriptional regulator [Lacticaseibacillus songhuajiangensis]